MAEAAAGSCGVIRNPREGSEVTKEWLEHMLTSYEGRRDQNIGVVVKVSKYEVKEGTKPGENVASELVKIWVEAEVTKEEEEEKEKKREEDEKKELKSTSTTTTTTTKEYNLMAKFNNGSEMDREYVRYINADLNELLIYSHVMQELNAFQERETGGKYRVAVPEFIYGVCDGDDYVLVMQDVSVLGYKTQDKHRGLDLAHTLMAAEHLARLHAVSHAYHHAHDFLHKFPTFAVDDNIPAFFLAFQRVVYDGVVEALKDHPEVRHITEKLKGNRDLLLGKLREVLIRGSDQHRVVSLSHGDAWTNNLMYSYQSLNGGADPASPTNPKDLILIDWGLLNWKNPILDLHHLVYNCTSLKLRRQHLQEILKLYHDTFTAATRDLKAPVNNYTFRAFLDEWERTSVFGFMTSGIFANAIVLSNRAREGFVKGTRSTGLMRLVAKGAAKVIVPVTLQGWLTPLVEREWRRKFQPMFEEVKEGNNHVLTSTLVDIITEAWEHGVIDQ